MSRQTLWDHRNINMTWYQEQKLATNNRKSFSVIVFHLHLHCILYVELLDFSGNLFFIYYFLQTFQCLTAQNTEVFQFLTRRKDKLKLKEKQRRKLNQRWTKEWLPSCLWTNQTTEFVWNKPTFHGFNTSAFHLQDLWPHLSKFRHSKPKNVSEPASHSPPSQPQI